MKSILKLLSVFIIFIQQLDAQTPSDHCSDPPILQVNNVYSINNLNTSQFTFGAPIQGHSSTGGNVKGFWFRVEIPTNFYATEIRIYNVSNNFDPVIGLKSHCTYSYYPNDNGHDYADQNGNGGSETFHTGLTGPDANNDGIYHIRIYHYNPNQTPTVNFKIKITGHYLNTGYDLSISNQNVDNTHPNAGDQIHLSCRQNFTGNCGSNYLNPNPKVGFFLSTNSTYESSNDLLLSDEYSTIGDTDSSDPASYNWHIPSNFSSGNYYILFVADYDNQHSETDEDNNTKRVLITIGSGCNGVNITQQPQDVTVSSGQTASFSVSVTGTSPFSYQWTKNGSNIYGATNSSYTTPSLSLSDNGNTYRCKITNCNGTVTSNAATVTVQQNCLAVSISQQPQTQYVTEGQTATFSVSVSGTAPFIYQWKKNGVAIPGATNSSYTTLPLTLANDGDYYNCRISNCNSNYQVSSYSVFTYVSSDTPSNITINNKNTTFSNPFSLWSGDTTQTISNIKVCADGSESTEIIFTNNSSVVSNNHIGFGIETTGTPNSDLDGSVSINSVNGSTITATYTHPNVVDSNRFIQIKIYDTANPGNILYRIPLTIYKTPVLMVHGLWGAPSTFDKMDTQLINSGYVNYLTSKADYYSSNDFSFNFNNYIVPQEIVNLLLSLRNHNFSAGKVDIVAHSMGGVLSRQYIQSQDYNDNVRKLITLNTPHSGSHLANPISNLVHYNIHGLGVAQQFLLNEELEIVSSVLFHGSIHKGAIDDLAVGSTAINNVNISFPSDVYFHSISTQYFQQINTNSTIFSIVDLLTRGLSPIYNNGQLQDVTTFINETVFSSSLVRHDLVVSLPSQKGGLNGNTTTNFNGQFHIGSAKNQDVINEVKYLLNIKPDNSHFYQGFNHVNTTSNFPINFTPRSQNPTTYNPQSNSIFINNPQDNQNFGQGSNMNINISSTNNIDKIVVYVIGQTESSYQLYEIQSANANINYTIPNDAYGKLTIMASGYSQNQLIDYDNVSVNIDNPSAYINQISFVNDTIYVPDNYVAPGSIKIHRSNGITEILPDYNNVQWTINDLNVAEHYQANLIKGNNVGTTNITATYQGFSTSAILKVYHNEIQVNGLPVLGIDDSGEKDETIRKLRIFPNPNKGIFMISTPSRINENVSISITNGLGMEIYNVTDFTKKTIYRKEIKLKNLPDGIYFIKLKIGNSNRFGKIIIRNH